MHKLLLNKSHKKSNSLLLPRVKSERFLNTWFWSRLKNHSYRRKYELNWALDAVMFFVRETSVGFNCVSWKKKKNITILNCCWVGNTSQKDSIFPWNCLCVFVCTSSLSVLCS